MRRESRNTVACTTRATPAAPAGGGRFRFGRGCGFLVALAMTATSVAAQQRVEVPSGQDVSLSEVLIDESSGETFVRFRFVAPQIARETGTIGYDVAAGDMEHLCRSLVLPYLAEYGLSPARVIISFSDREVPFGVADPDATQFFEAYRPENADCIWEEF